jgi:hypothetical protein
MSRRPWRAELSLQRLDGGNTAAQPRLTWAERSAVQGLDERMLDVTHKQMQCLICLSLSLSLVVRGETGANADGPVR